MVGDSRHEVFCLGSRNVGSLCSSKMISVDAAVLDQPVAHLGNLLIFFSACRDFRARPNGTSRA